jgi:CheY-like chemotaxis protein
MIMETLAAKPAAPETTRNRTGLRAAPRGSMTLVVDDDPDCREATARLLTEAGHRVRTARGISSALAEIADSDIGLVITDLWMPEGNGMQLVEQLAANRPDMRVIVFSGHATAATRQAALNAGCLDVVDKPNIGDLLAAAHKSLANDREARLNAARPIPQKPRLGRVLLADDHPEVVSVVSRLLDRSGYDMVTARDGAEALQRFTPGAFDLVLLDVNMPRIDGVAATREIHRRDQAVSILLITGEASSDQMRTATAAGATSIFAKPMDLALLEQLARTYVVETRSQRQRLEQATRRAQRSVPARAAHWMTSRSTRRSRNRAMLLVACVVLSIAITPVAVTVTEWGCDAAGATAGFIGSIPSRLAFLAGFLDHIEGYLDRDEQREIEALEQRRGTAEDLSTSMSRLEDSFQRAEQRGDHAAGTLAGSLGRFEGYLLRDEERKMFAAGRQAPLDP